VVNFKQPFPISHFFNHRKIHNATSFFCRYSEWWCFILNNIRPHTFLRNRTLRVIIQIIINHSSWSNLISSIFRVVSIYIVRLNIFFTTKAAVITNIWFECIYLARGRILKITIKVISTDIHIRRATLQ
jgi:hypothetical protein